MPEENEIYIYTCDKEGDSSPFEDWLTKLDKREKAIVHARITRMWVGNFGSCKPIVTDVGGIFELVIDTGPGYRIYYGRDRGKIIILLCGGSKRSQTRDIDKASKYWKDYKSSGEKRKGLFS